MLPIIIDVVLVIILAGFSFNGVRKGLILGISGIVIMIISFYAAGVVANTYSERFKPMIEPIVSKLVDKSVTQAKSDETPSTANSNSKDEVGTLGLDSLLKLGLFKDTAQNVITDLKGTITTVGQDFKNAVTKKVTASVTYILTFITAYLVITLVLTLLARLLDAAFKLPGLGFINGTGGFLLGFIKGMLVLFVIAWAMRYFGGIFPDETTDKTVILKWLMSNNLLAAFFGV